MNDPWVVAGKIAEALDALNGVSGPHSVSGPHGASGLRKEIARLKAINAKLSGDVTKKTVELSKLREAQTRGGQAIELQRQHEEIRDLREELHFKEIEIKELKASLEHKDKAAIQISRNNAHLRSEIYDVKCARDAYRQDGIELRDVLAEIRRALDDHDNEKD